jgi:predicted small integral membrane protein
MYRSITSPWFHYAGYLTIILFELMTAFFCLIGGVQLLRSIRASKEDFHSAKKYATAGLTLGFLTWQVAFMSIGGEWFGMWMSQTWNGVDSAFRFFITQLVALIYVTLPND